MLCSDFRFPNRIFSTGRLSLFVAAAVLLPLPAFADQVVVTGAQTGGGSVSTAAAGGPGISTSAITDSNSSTASVGGSKGNAHTTTKGDAKGVNKSGNQLTLAKARTTAHADAYNKGSIPIASATSGANAKAVAVTPAALAS